ncbi:MAG: 3-hydroxyanthranilate 3,4-dioxygenase [Pseudomonadota bacterium]
MASFARPFNFQDWIERHRPLMKPPVSNRLVFEEPNGLIIQVIGGGNRRVDFHDDPAQEFFYQLQGDMILKVMDRGQMEDILIREGDVFLLPPNVPHSPQRPLPNSVGLVVEGPRLPGQKDGFEWYCFNCGDKIHRVEITLSNIVADLPPLFDAFYANTDQRRCKNCGTVHPGKEPPADWAVL